MREARFYRTKAGHCPVEEFLDQLGGKQAQHGGDTFRLIGFFDGTRLLVLASGFAKKTAKIPRQEIAVAERRRDDYMSRRHEHE